MISQEHGLRKKLKEWSSILDADNVYINQSVTAISTGGDGMKALIYRVKCGSVT